MAQSFFYYESRKMYGIYDFYKICREFMEFVGYFLTCPNDTVKSFTSLSPWLWNSINVHVSFYLYQTIFNSR